MAVQASHLTWLMLISFTLSMLVICCHGSSDGRQVYIVYMGKLPKADVSSTSLHTSMLQDVVYSSTVASDALLYSYHRSFNGFAAKLTEEEANKLRGKEGVVSVFLSQKKQLLTSRSWDFMGFTRKVKRSVIENEIIVGMLDSGIWPESQSFNDTGFGPIPTKWKGTCQSSANFTCNKKIIGAKCYRANGDFGPNDIRSPRDSGGHGSHTASTAAGNFVSGASLYGLAKGTVRGGVPSARIAVYKICWHGGCNDEDILAAFDDAIADGVDIISLSVGNLGASDYFDDSIAIGAFHSMKNGILTSNAAAASTISRKFVTKLELGTGEIYEPDLTAPGVDILAAWSEAHTLTREEGDTRVVPYNIISGTSMACPHATGAAAYVKSFHPTWSPAAIKSALMTTAFPMSTKNNLEGEFAYGAGHINPAKAAQPGLMYDAGEIDYVKFLRGQGYSPKQLQLITGYNNCSEETNGTVWDLNYPSFALSTTPGKSITRVFHRTVTNVGSAVSTYKAVVKVPEGLIIQVQPSVLSFNSLGQEQSFVVTVAADVGNSMLSGSLTWDDGVYQVRSPIVAYASLTQ
ncbi:hypothetical protein PTKIN_Ptkin16aG0520900 [Pterospermum kingtungense]